MIGCPLVIGDIPENVFFFNLKPLRKQFLPAYILPSHTSSIILFRLYFVPINMCCNVFGSRSAHDSVKFTKHLSHNKTRAFVNGNVNFSLKRKNYHQKCQVRLKIPGPQLLKWINRGPGLGLSQGLFQNGEDSRRLAFRISTLNGSSTYPLWVSLDTEKRTEMPATINSTVYYLRFCAKEPATSSKAGF